MQITTNNIIRHLQSLTISVHTQGGTNYSKSLATWLVVVWN